jgi:hypothetical protein
VAEVLRELDQNSPELESDIGELEELRDILARPHVRVSNTVCFESAFFRWSFLIIQESKSCTTWKKLTHIMLTKYYTYDAGFIV